MIERSIRSSKKGESSNFGLFRTYLGSFHQMDHLFQHFKKNLSKIQCPIYLLHSSEDSMVSTENAMLLYCKLPSSDKRLEYINGCDHVMTVDLRKQDVAQKIEQFINEQQNKTSNTSCLPLSQRGAEVWMQDQNIA
jgi:carboxylesterase